MGTLAIVKTKNDFLWEWQIIIGTGIFATGLAQPEVLALPFRRLLSEELGVDAEKMAIFFWVTSLPWSLKILPGLLLDSVPFFGTRRFYYLVVGVAFAAFLWPLLNFVQSSFIGLATLCMIINVFLVIASSSGGALFVEGGQRLNAMDRLASTRVFVDNVNTVVAGPLSGWLADLSFSVCTFVGALIPLSLLPPVMSLLQEPTTAKYEESALRDAWNHIKIVVESGGFCEVALTRGRGRG